MYLGMAVGTVPDNFEASASGVIVIVIQEVPDMPTTTLGSYICMALLAQLRALLVQQGSVVRTVNPVAKCAIFTGGIMFPQEGAALLGMAAVTVLVNCEFI